MARRSAGGPENLGGPPGDLSERPLPLAPRARPAYRIHWLGRDPVHFGKNRQWRFDDPLGRCGVMYVAQTPEGAFAETLLPSAGVLSPTTTLVAGSVPVSSTTIAMHGLASVAFHAPLRCVDLTGQGLASVGADASIATGPWRISQQWSGAFFAHPSQPDALLYRCRRDPASLALALHERARPKIAVTQLGGLSEPQHVRLLSRIVQRYSVVIVPG